MVVRDDLRADYYLATFINATFTKNWTVIIWKALMQEVHHHLLVAVSLPHIPSTNGSPVGAGTEEFPQEFARAPRRPTA